MAQQPTIKSVIIALITVFLSFVMPAQAIEEKERPFTIDFIHKSNGFNQNGFDIGFRYVTAGVAFGKSVTMQEDKGKYSYDEEYNEHTPVDISFGCLFSTGKDKNAVFLFNPTFTVSTYDIDITQDYSSAEEVLVHKASPHLDLYAGVSIRQFNVMAGVTHVEDKYTAGFALKLGFSLYGYNRNGNTLVDSFDRYNY